MPKTKRPRSPATYPKPGVTGPYRLLLSGERDTIIEIELNLAEGGLIGLQPAEVSADELHAAISRLQPSSGRPLESEPDTEYALLLCPGSGKSAQFAHLIEAMSSRSNVLQHVTNAVANQPAGLGPATTAQIGLVDQRWREIEDKYGVVDAGEYAEWVGGSPTNRSLASKARKRGLLGFRRGQKVLYPRFQLDARGIREGWQQMVAPLRNAGWDDEDIILWLVSPNGGLGRETPLEIFEADRGRLLKVVGDEAAGLW